MGRGPRRKESLGGGDAEAIQFPLPPVPELQRIVLETERRFSVVDAIVDEVEKAFARG